MKPDGINLNTLNQYGILNPKAEYAQAMETLTDLLEDQLEMLWSPAYEDIEKGLLDGSITLEQVRDRINQEKQLLAEYYAWQLFLTARVLEVKMQSNET